MQYSCILAERIHLDLLNLWRVGQKKFVEIRKNYERGTSLWHRFYLVRKRGNMAEATSGRHYFILLLLFYPVKEKTFTPGSGAKYTQEVQ